MGSKQPRQYYCRCGTHLAKDNNGRQCARCQRESRDKLITPPEVPTEFWQTEQFAEAFAAQHMGRVSRAYRTHSYHHAVYGPYGISQSLLGEWLGLSQAQVSRFETGPPLQYLDTLRRWAQVMRIPPELLWFRLPEQSQPLALAELVDKEVVVSDSHGTGELPAVRWTSDLEDATQAAVVLCEHVLDHSRPADTVDTTSLSTLTLRWLVGPADNLTFCRAGCRRVGLGDVTRLRVVRRQLKALDDALGGGTAFPMAVTYLRREIMPLLGGSYDDATGRALFSATAELHLDVGWMAYDAGDCALAGRYMVHALRLSHAVDNRLFGGRVLAAMSHQALHLGHVPLALDLVRAAREGTKHIAPPKVHAMVAAMEACAQAAAHERRSCTTV
ncbi:MAG: helix-turn-helix domain-containing protein, partial [Pseudonocardiaceae bacterium]